jgi:hypothetical protein
MSIANLRYGWELIAVDEEQRVRWSGGMVANARSKSITGPGARVHLARLPGRVAVVLALPGAGSQQIPAV